MQNEYSVSCVYLISNTQAYLNTDTIISRLQGDNNSEWQNMYTMSCVHFQYDSFFKHMLLFTDKALLGITYT